MKLDLLLAHCGDLGVEVEWRDLGPRRRGQYEDDLRLITLNTRLNRAQATAVCAHECGHAVFRDRCSNPANERRAWEYGASLIISPAEYAEAEQMAGPHAGALAESLGVTPKLIEAWRRWFKRRHPLELARLSHIQELVDSGFSQEEAVYRVHTSRSNKGPQ